MFCSVEPTYLKHFVQSVSYYAYCLVYISVFREWPTESVHNWIGTMTLRTKAIILCRKLSGFHILKSIWGTWELSLLALLTCLPLLPQPRKKPPPPIPISITMKASSIMRTETPDLMKTVYLIPPISMTVMMTSIQLTHTILQTWTLVGPKPNVNPECIHFY